VTTRAALIGTTVFAVVLMVCGAVLSVGSLAMPRATAPPVIPVRVVVLNPASGAVTWSSVPLPTHLVLDPATGRVVSPVRAGASTSAP
jgi:hypothetical protein